MKLQKYIFNILFCLVLSLPLLAMAQTGNNVTNTVTGNPMTDRLRNVGTGAGYVDEGESGVLNIVGSVINALLGLLGAIFIILILLAGYNWMTANGDETKIEKAKDTIRASIIGIIIIVGAFAIWRFVSGYLIGGGGTGYSNGGGSGNQ